MTIEVAAIVSAVSVAFGIYAGVLNIKRNHRVDAQKDSSQMTTVIVKLESISAVLAEVKAELISTIKELKALTERLIITEQSSKQAHKRIDAHDLKITDLIKTLNDLLREQG